MNPSETIRTLAVLGSGGHTSEMLQLTSRLSGARYTPLCFVVADTDHTSRAKVEASPGGLRPDEYVRIPRSREVGEPFLRSAFKTLYALAWSLVLVGRRRPQLILCNGPGTCLPICMAAFCYRVLFFMDVRIVFCESFCRVTTLSLTGKLLYPIADRFVVQWPQLRERCVASGRQIHADACQAASARRLHRRPSRLPFAGTAEQSTWAFFVDRALQTGSHSAVAGGRWLAEPESARLLNAEEVRL